MMNPAPTSPMKLRIIRMAMLAGVLMFGVLAYYLSRQPRAEPVDAGALQTGNIILLIVAGIGLLVVQRVHAAQRDPAKRATFNIIAWALGEAVALFGGVYLLLTGEVTPYLVGLAMMIASFGLVPIRE